MTDDELRKLVVTAAGGQTKGIMDIHGIRRLASLIAEEERRACLAEMGALHDSIVASAIMQSDETVATILRHVAEAGVGSAMTLIEKRGKPCGS